MQEKDFIKFYLAAIMFPLLNLIISKDKENDLLEASIIEDLHATGENYKSILSY